MNAVESIFRCMISRTLGNLIIEFESHKISIFDYTLYIDEDNTPIVLKSKADYETYLAYHLLYVIDNATFDGITYHKVIRIMSPKTK